MSGNDKTADCFGNFRAEVSGVRRAADAVAPASEQLCIELEVYPNFGETQTVRFLLSELDNLDLEKRGLGVVYSNKAAKRQLREMVRNDISHWGFSADVPVYYPSTGLFLEPYPAFAAGEQIISSSDGGPVLLDKCLYLALPSAGADIPAFLGALEQDPAHRIPAFAYTICSHLRSFWRHVGIGNCGVLYLTGPQGYGKTTLAENFCTLYDTGSTIADRYDARSTPAALKHALADARDRVVLFDDVCASANSQAKRQRLNAALDILRTAANGSPIVKKQGGQVISMTCSAGLVITGEFLETAPSELTRCIILNIDTPNSGGTPQDRPLAAGALYTYLEWLVHHADGELERCRGLLADVPPLDRMRKNYFQLNFSFDSFLHAVRTPELAARIQGLGQRADAIFVKCLRWQEQHLIELQHQQNPFSKPLRDYITCGIRARMLHPVSHLGVPCLLPEELLQFLRQYAPWLQVREMTTLLRNESLLCMDESGKSTKKFNGRRYLHLKL